MISTVLLILAFASFIAAVANFPVPRINFVALGLALWIASEFATRIH